MGFRLLGSVVLALVTSWSVPGVLGGPVQSPDIVMPSDAAANRQRYAYGHDDLSPVSLSYSDSYGGWGATIVDALDTMDLFEQAVNWTTSLDFTVTPTDDEIDLFETTIRYVAASLCAYELSGEKYPALVKQAQALVDKMSNAWVGDNAVPYGYMNWNQSVPVVGTLTLEWGTLANFTGNDTYRVLAEKPVRWIANLVPLPGLPAQGIDPSTGDFVGSYVTWGGGSDSYFEYLIKYARLTNTDDTLFADAWATAVDSSLHNLARTSTVQEWQYLADWDDGTIIHIGSHLECYHAGNWILGGSLLNNATIVNFALDLMDACWNTYASTATGIGPEVFGYFSSDGNYTGSSPSSGDLAFYERHGFFVYPGDSDYYLRPEVLESNFYAWRATGDVRYYENAVSALESFETWLPAPVAYAGIDDVDATDSAFIDDMQSFWFAEVLKYLYLTFSDPSVISLDDYVFNTEAHPFKAPPAKATYGSGNLFVPSGTFAPQAGPLPQVSPAPPVAPSPVPPTPTL
ncbi:glycoside hydrolase [Sparassis latifolia]